MNYIYRTFLPKNSFTSVIYDKLSIYYNIDLFTNKDHISTIIVKNNSNELEYNYKIDFLKTSTTFNTTLSMDFDNQKLKIYEKIKFYNYKNNKSVDYSCNITQDIAYKISNNKPLIHSIKCCHQQIGFDLSNHYNNYNKDMQDIFEYFIKNHNQKN